MARTRQDTETSSSSRAVAAGNEFEEVVDDAKIPKDPEQPTASTLPTTSVARRRQTLADCPLNLAKGLELDAEETILYLAYGSNLSDKKFMGDRGIRPRSSINVQVPALRMTFDLAGIPYTEPCFANSAYREVEGTEKSDAQSTHKHMPLVASGQEDPKDAWKKPMIGVAYELTRADMAKVLATEGGGSSYQDIVVDCYPFATSDPSVEVPWRPQTERFKAHTLFAPRSTIRGARQRQPSHAQPSARYLKFLVEGAEQRGLPHEYRSYLGTIKSYSITTRGQNFGRAFYAHTFIPLLLTFVRSSKFLADETGRAPWWYNSIVEGLFQATWLSYDWLMRPLFGDGERSANVP